MGLRCCEGRRNDMGQVRVFYDAAGQTLTVWFDDPELEHTSEETGDELFLMKDAGGRVIGFEKLNFVPSDLRDVRLDFQTVGV